MERKLVKQGKSTLMVSLPKEWLDSHSLEKGDSLVCEVKRNTVTYYSKNQASRKEAQVDISNLDRSSIMFMLRGLYRVGRSPITLQFKQPVAEHHRTGVSPRVSSIVSTEVDRLLGLEVISNTSQSIGVDQLAEIDVQRIDSRAKSAMFLVGETYNDIILGMQNNDAALLESTEEKHDAVTKMVSYCLRALSQVHPVQKDKYTAHIVMQFDVIIDILKYFTRQAAKKENKFSKGSVNVLKNLARLHEIFSELYLAWENERAQEFNRVREETKNSFEMLLKTDDAGYIGYLMPVIEIYRDMIQSIICIRSHSES